MNEIPPVGRLALRVVGDDWKAFYALPDTMEGAFLLGSIKLGIVKNSVIRKQEFVDLMTEVVADLIEAACGERPSSMRPQVAPSHEKIQ